MGRCRAAASLFLVLAVFFSGCSRSSYPAAGVKEAILKICREEYGIEELDVQIAGDTLGVFLPLGKLFASDFKETAVAGKVRNLESLFEPSPEALEKVEDVLFSLSRVILSTDYPFKFYVLEATDVEKTGMQLVVTGHVEDMKRVRVWDISRNEYRKRLIHDLKLNRAVLWHRPVRNFFKDLSRLPVEEVKRKYFKADFPSAVFEQFFLGSFWNGSPRFKKYKWEILDIRSTAVQKDQAFVYVKVQAPLNNPEARPQELQYIFAVAVHEVGGEILKIIPFQYRDEQGNLQTIPFPPELQAAASLDRWEIEFALKEVQVGDFLAQQMTRRAQGIFSSDERIQNTFRDLKMNFEYDDTQAEPFFAWQVEAVLKEFNRYTKESIAQHEDMVYVLELILREFVEVMRGYKFEDYGSLRLNVVQEPVAWVFAKQDLELFRRKKITLKDLLTTPLR